VGPRRAGATRRVRFLARTSERRRGAAHLRELGIRPSKFRLGDVLREAAFSLVGHPARSMLTAAGTAIGAAAFVATLGLSSTLTQQVSNSFDVRRATEVVVGPTDQQSADPGSGGAPPWQSAAAGRRLARLNGVAAAGGRLVLPECQLSRMVGSAGGAVGAQVIGVDSAVLDVIEPRVTLGRTFQAFHDSTGAPVALVPAGLAARLSISRVGVAVFIDDRPFTVIGIFDEVARRPESLLSVLVPRAAAEPLDDRTQPGVRRDVVIRTSAGAAQLIADQAPLALSPEDPARLRATAPPDPRTLRREVEDNVVRLSLVLSAVALAIGAVSIANTATAGIAARVPEIGLRRAIGARRKHVFAQLLAETTALGLVGGIAGTLLGGAVTVIVALVNGWQPVVDPRVAALATCAATAAGLLAGLLPAVRAVRIQPLAALQR
jgi:putative ABC transport system permease protein